MLVELRDIEVHIEPREILQQALQDYDLPITDAIATCLEESSSFEILDCIEQDTIKQFVEERGIYIENYDHYSQILNGVKKLASTEKAMLLWQLLKEEV